MMKNHKGDQGHSLSGPGNQTGACPRCGLLNGAHAERCPTLNAGLGEKGRKSTGASPTQIEGEVPCPKCGRELQHRPYCPIYIAQQMRKPSTEADDRTRAELAQHVEIHGRLLVMFKDFSTKQGLMDLELDYEMSALVPVVDDLVSPFGARDPRTYKVMGRYFVLDPMPVIIVYLEKIDG